MRLHVNVDYVRTMIPIQLYDEQTIDTLKWPDTKEASQMRTHLLPMIKEGVKPYINNVETKLCVLHINNHVIPLTINNKEYDNSYLTSNYFTIKYLQEQLTKKKSRVLKHLQLPIIQTIGLLLKAIKINKVVIFNNWLLTMNIYPDLSDHELLAAREFLTKRFPDHMLLFRNLNMYRCSMLASQLKKQNYRLIFARNVCIYDPTLKAHFSSKVNYHHRRDRKLIGDEGYEAIGCEKMPPEEISRLIQLYNELYLKRHTIYSPHYTEKFLKEAIEKKFLHLVCLKKEGQIHGVIGFYEREGVLIAPFCGYDQVDAHTSHLYRMLTMLAIDEAEKRKVHLNDGSGGSAPKQYRGMKAFPEYIALYDRHLPRHRQLFWSLAEKMIKWLVIDKINKL